jgi:hypothetical protein
MDEPLILVGWLCWEDISNLCLEVFDGSGRWQVRKIERARDSN